jgi:uncharacterized protein (DUF1330 family)
MMMAFLQGVCHVAAPDHTRKLFVSGPMTEINSVATVTVRSLGWTISLWNRGISDSKSGAAGELADDVAISSTPEAHDARSLGNWKGSHEQATEGLYRISTLPLFACDTGLLWEADMLRPMIVMLSLAGLMSWHVPALAHGGHGGFHFRRGFGSPSQVGLSAYVVIDFSTTADPETLKTAQAKLATALVSFSGHIIIDADNPIPLDGNMPQHYFLIAFDNMKDAQAWRNSDSFKEFDADRRRAGTSRMFLVEGISNGAPVSNLDARGRHMRFDPAPFEKIIRKRDEDLNRIKDICKGC